MTVTFIDFKRAFDTVSHDRLLLKLEDIGIKGKIKSWFESYLKNRKTIVKLQDVQGREHDVKVGIPQGSSLAPILFIIYTNGLQKILKYSRVFAFADDLAQ